MSIILDQKGNFLQTIENSVGTNMFRNLWADVDGVRKDILDDGDLSCAQFVSGILYLFDLITTRHSTVTGTVKDMENNGWKKISEPEIGSVLVWEKISFPDGSEHAHIGFYIGDNEAISNSPRLKSPQKHHWTFGEQGKPNFRAVSAIYTSDKLD